MHAYSLITSKRWSPVLRWFRTAHSFVLLLGFTCLTHLVSRLSVACVLSSVLLVSHPVIRGQTRLYLRWIVIVFTWLAGPYPGQAVYGPGSQPNPYNNSGASNYNEVGDGSGFAASAFSEKSIRHAFIRKVISQLHGCLVIIVQFFIPCTCRFHNLVPPSPCCLLVTSNVIYLHEINFLRCLFHT